MNGAANRWSMVILILSALLAISGFTAGVVAGFLLALAWTWYAHRESLRKLWNPRFWSFSIAVTLLAGMLLGENPQYYRGIPISPDGLLAGVRMTLRAFTLVLTFSLLARSLPRQRVIHASKRLGLPHLDPAFQEAFSAMPRAGETLRRSIRQGGGRLDALARLLANMADTAQAEQMQPSPVFAVTGKQGSGKTAALRKCKERATIAGYKVVGVLQERQVHSDGENMSFFAHRIGKEERVLIAEGMSGIGFTFSQSGFLQVREWMMKDAEGADLIILDELGRLEAEGGGHAPLFQILLEQYPEQTPLYLVSLRKDKLVQLQQRFRILGDRIHHLDRVESAIDACCMKLLDYLDHTCKQQKAGKP